MNYSLQPTIKDAMNLILKGNLALSKVESNGIKIDVPYMKQQMELLSVTCNDLAMKVARESEIGRRWKEKYGSSFTLASGDQLADILYKDMGFTPAKKTSRGKDATDREVLANLPAEFSDNYIRWKKMENARTRYIKNILREVSEGGMLYTNFNLNIAWTYRSSSNSPNFQNIPIRDKEIGKIIRSGFIPRSPDRQILEIDFKGAEVTVGACVHKDPNMIAYVTNALLDMHRDTAMDCFILPEDEVWKPVRNLAKGDMVFATFYGSYFEQTAAAMWKEMHDDKIKTKSGKLLSDHLASMGIHDLDGFKAHIKKVEDIFWNVRFKGYKKWRDDTWAEYQEKGFLDIVTGFRILKPLIRNQAINVPIQGPSFHCLLRTLCYMVYLCEKYKFKSVIAGQIHDSMVCDIVPAELEAFFDCFCSCLEKTRKEWPWLEIPIKAETEIAPIGRSWFEKAEIDLTKVA